MKKRTISFSPPDITESEIAEVAETLRSGWITTGPRTKLLERRLAAYLEKGSVTVDCESQESIKRYNNRVVCLNSATASEELNLRILGIKPGDEVIVPAYTYTSTASAAIHAGATVRFVDIQRGGDSQTCAPEMDYKQLEMAITEKTKAVIPVDLGGVVCNYDRIFEILERKKSLFIPLDSGNTGIDELSSRIQQAIGRVAVVADCAHSLGANRVVAGEKGRCGTIADFSSFSFHAVKNLTTAEGGAATWKCLPSIDNEEIYHQYQLYSLHGQSKDALMKNRIGAWEYDVVGSWYKCNMTDIAAAIGLRQLDRYPQLIQRRREIIKKYDEVCDEMGIMHLTHMMDNMSSSGHLYLTRIPGATDGIRREIIIRLAERGVNTNVHYKPLPMMTAYKQMGWDIKDFPNAYDYYSNLITLPLHTKLTDEDVDYIVSNFREVVGQFF